MQMTLPMPTERTKPPKRRRAKRPPVLIAGRAVPVSGLANRLRDTYRDPWLNLGACVVGQAIADAAGDGPQAEEARAWLASTPEALRMMEALGFPADEVIDWVEGLQEGINNANL